MVRRIPQRRASDFPFLFGSWGRGLWALAFKGCAGHLASVATAPEVVPNRDAIIFEGDERGDFGREELGPLESVSSEVYLERSLVVLEA